MKVIAAAGLRARFLNCLLGVEPVRRVHVGRVARAGAVYVVSAFCEWLYVVFGFGDPMQIAWLIFYMMAGTLAFFAMVRSGWSGRFPDPALTMSQAIFAVTILALAYPINGPARGLNLLLLSLPLFGFMSLRQSQLRALAAFSLLVFGGMMLVLAHLVPQRFDPRVEALNFAIAAICLPAMALLLGQIRTMRDRARAQRADLRRAIERIEAMATHDELTGLVNRRRMSVLLGDELLRRARQAAPFCVVLIDLDHFKRINDTFGHAKGDEVLRRFARIASVNLHEAYVLARWGGEEFLLLLPGTSAQAAVVVMQKMRERLANVCEWHDCPELQVSFSAGIAEDCRGDLTSLLERADQALYQAKAEGRDQSVCADRAGREGLTVLHRVPISRRRVAISAVWVKMAFPLFHGCFLSASQ